MKELTKRILKEGVENIMFLVPMRPLNVVFGLFAYTSSSDEEVIVPCKITESGRYKVEEDYKIEVKSIYQQFGKKSFYTSDLQSLILDGQIEMYVNEKSLTDR